MLKIFTSLFLIFLIFLQIPQENIGLTSIKSNSVSPRYAQRFLKILTIVGIFIYFGIAIQLNLLNNQF